MGVAGQGVRSFDIIKQIHANVVNVFNKRPSICTSPCDGMILKMHYQWTFWIFLGCFSSIWYSWFNRDVITCVSHYNADVQIRLDYANICLSYPYIKTEHGRRYILYYRWIHWCLLFMAAVYYMPRKLSKVIDDANIKKLFEDLAVRVCHYDPLAEKEQVERVSRYIAFNIKTHNGLYFKHLMCNVVALVIDLFCFCFLDFVFQGRFMQYGIRVYPFNRDVQTFTDYMSQTFPPFAECQLTPKTQLTIKRVETFGCHLTVMELYEKLFLIIWLWLIVLMGLTVIYILFLLFLWMPSVRRHILRVSKPIKAHLTVRTSVCRALNNCKIGDVFILYRLRQFFSYASYYELLTRLGDPNFGKNMIDTIPIDHHNPNGGNMDVRQHNKVPIKSRKIDSRYQLPNSSILLE